MSATSPLLTRAMAAAPRSPWPSRPLCVSHGPRRRKFSRHRVQPPSRCRMCDQGSPPPAAAPSLLALHAPHHRRGRATWSIDPSPQPRGGSRATVPLPPIGGRKGALPIGHSPTTLLPNATPHLGSRRGHPIDTHAALARPSRPGRWALHEPQELPRMPLRRSRYLGGGVANRPPPPTPDALCAHAWPAGPVRAAKQEEAALPQCAPRTG